MRESLRAGNDGDVLITKTNAVKRVKELSTPIPPDTLEPSTEADIKFSASADVISVCQNYGQVFAPGSPDPSQCYVTGQGVQGAVVGEKSTAILQIVNFEGKPCDKPIKKLECDVMSEITGTRASCKAGIINTGVWSHYEIIYQPTIKGRHQLHIKAEGQPIRSSPFSIAVTDFGTPIGSMVGTLGVVGRPWGVAINQSGEVMISEVGEARVSVFSLSGRKLRSFSIRGPGGPCGVAAYGEGNILIACHSIQKFTAEGQFLTAVGTKGSGPLQFSEPRGIVFNAANSKVYVADVHNHRVQVLNSDLTFSSAFGKYGSSKGQFKEPWGIACDNTGKVFVADTGNNRIQVFTAEGRFCVMFGRCGENRRELESPSGVAVDSRGMVYVSEWGNHRVSVFTSEGQYVTSFGRMGEGPGEFGFPSGLAVDNSGVVYVCDYYNNRVQMF